MHHSQRQRRSGASGRLVLGAMFVAAFVMIGVGLQALMATPEPPKRAAYAEPFQRDAQPAAAGDQARPPVDDGMAVVPGALREALLAVPQLEGALRGERVSATASAPGSSADAFVLDVCPPTFARPCQKLFLRALRGSSEERARQRQVHAMDERVEMVSLTRAASEGVAPVVVGLLPQAGAVVSEWRDLRAAGARCGEPAAMAAAAQVLARLHAVALSAEDRRAAPASVDDGAVIARVRARLAFAAATAPPRADELVAAMERLAVALHAARWMRVAYVHGDPSPSNVMLDPEERAWLVDFEYAGVGDRFFDVANYGELCGLDGEGDARWLQAYVTAAARSERVAALVAPFEVTAARYAVLRFFALVQRASRLLADDAMGLPHGALRGGATAAELFRDALVVMDSPQIQEAARVLEANPAPGKDNDATGAGLGARAAEAAGF